MEWVAYVVMIPFSAIVVYGIGYARGHRAGLQRGRRDGLFAIDAPPRTRRRKMTLDEFLSDSRTTFTDGT